MIETSIPPLVIAWPIRRPRSGNVLSLASSVLHLDLPCLLNAIEALIMSLAEAFQENVPRPGLFSHKTPHETATRQGKGGEVVLPAPVERNIAHG